MFALLGGGADVGIDPDILALGGGIGDFGIDIDIFAPLGSGADIGIDIVTLQGWWCRCFSIILSIQRYHNNL